MNEEFTMNWKVGIIILMIVAYILGYLTFKYTNADSGLVKQYKNNFDRCTSLCNSEEKLGFITMTDDTHYKCICG